MCLSQGILKFSNAPCIDSPCEVDLLQYCGRMATLSLRFDVPLALMCNVLSVCDTHLRIASDMFGTLLDRLDTRLCPSFYEFNMLHRFQTSYMGILPRSGNGGQSFIDDLRVSSDDIQLLLMLIQHVVMLGLGLVDKLIRLVELVCLMMLRTMQVQLWSTARRRRSPLLERWWPRGRSANITRRWCQLP